MQEVALGAADRSEVSQLLWLPTDQALYDCPEYRPYFIKYARSKEDFFTDYAAAHKKMSELGARFRFRITIDDVNVTAVGSKR